MPYLCGIFILGTGQFYKPCLKLNVKLCGVFCSATSQPSHGAIRGGKLAAQKGMCVSMLGFLMISKAAGAGVGQEAWAQHCQPQPRAQRDRPAYIVYLFCEFQIALSQPLLENCSDPQAKLMDSWQT